MKKLAELYQTRIVKNHLPVDKDHTIEIPTLKRKKVLN